MTRTGFTMGAVLAGGALSVLLGATATAGMAPKPLVERMAASFAGVSDYEVVVNGTQWNGGKTSSQQYRYAFKKPGMVRLSTLSGPDKGGELVVRPDGKIRGRKNEGVLKVFAVTMDRSDERLRGSDGVGVWEMDFGSEIARISARIEKGAQGSVSGPDRATGAYALALRYGQGPLAGVVDTYSVDARSLWITGFERTRGGSLLERRIYTGLRVNPGFTNKYFEF